MSLVFTAVRRQANTILPQMAVCLAFKMILYNEIQETSGKEFGVMGSCDLRFIRAAPVHITQQTGHRLMTQEEILLKRAKGGTITL